MLKQFKSFFDLKMGLVGALFMGTVVFIVNYHHGFSGAITASLKQAAYTFIAGGFLLKLCENLARKLENVLASIVLAVLVATSIAAGLTFVVHSLKGTPEPVNSTLITVALAIPGFAWWGYRGRVKG